MRNRTFALELVRQLEIVTIRDPTLAKYVEIVNVEIGAYARDSLLAELAPCLALFSNLHTVQLKLEHDPKVNEDAITIPFKGYIYRSVRKVVVSSNALPFLVSCPESQFVDSYEFVYYPELFWSYIATYCLRIQVTSSNAIIPTDRLRGKHLLFKSMKCTGLFYKILPEYSLTSATSHCGKVTYFLLEDSPGSQC